MKSITFLVLLACLDVPFWAEASGSNFCYDHAEGLYPHDVYCTKYYQCDASGNTFVMPCPLGLQFNPSADYCDWPNNVDCDKVCEVETEGYNYRYLPFTVDVARIEFSVKTSRDAHVSLSPHQSKEEIMYEIVIGGNGNKYAQIRRGPLCCRKVDHIESGLVSDSEFRDFWITYDFATGKLAVGKKDQQAFIQWVDPSPIDVKYVGFSSYGSATGSFRYPCSW